MYRENMSYQVLKGSFVKLSIEDGACISWCKLHNLWFLFFQVKLVVSILRDYDICNVLFKHDHDRYKLTFLFINLRE